MTRWVIVLAFAFLACTAPAPSIQPQAQPTVVIRTDATLLAQRIRLPDGLQSVAWTVIPLGKVGGAAPGPTDTRLYAFLRPLNIAVANSRPLAPGEQQQTEATIPREIARSLLPTDTVAGLLGSVDEPLQLSGTRYDPGAFARGSYFGLYAMQLGDGLLVCLQSG